MPILKTFLQKEVLRGRKVRGALISPEQKGKYSVGAFLQRLNKDSKEMVRDWSAPFSFSQFSTPKTYLYTCFFPHLHWVLLEGGAKTRLLLGFLQLQ